MKNKICGIYLITEKATGRMYVGLAGANHGIKERWKDYKNRFPQELFTYEILHPCPPGTTREELSLLEKFYIRELDCMEPKGFNKTSGGCGKTEISEETKKRQSAARKGIPKSEEHKAKLRGWTHSEESRANMSAALKGRVSPSKGKPHSEETKAKCSAANKGRVKGPMSEEEKAKRRGWTHSEESRAKQSAAQKGRVSPNKGKPHSEETKAKCSAAVKAQWALKRAAKAAAIAALEALLFAETETILSPE